MARATFDAASRARARELYDLGQSCNAIAKAVGFAPSTISRWAAKEGLRFDREKTAIAVRAHTVDMKESRILLAQKLLVIAHDLADSIDKPYLAFNFGGKDNTYEEHTLPTPPVDAQRTIVATAGIAIDKASRILEKDNGGLDDALGILDAIGGNIEAAAELLRARDETPTDGA